MYHVCTWHLWRPEDISYPGSGVIDGYEPLCGCWFLNLGPLQEQVHLTPKAFLAFQLADANCETSHPA